MTGMMVAGLVMMAGSQVVGAVQQGAAARAAANASIATGNYNKAIADYNKTMALQEADIARKLAKNRAVGALQAGEMHIGKERTLLAANGVDLLDLDSSSLLALEQTASDYAATGEIELYNGEVEAVQKTNQASLFESQGEFAAWKGRTEANAYLAQAPTVLGTVLKVGGTVGMGVGSMGMNGAFGASSASSGSSMAGSMAGSSKWNNLRWKYGIS